MEMPERQPKEIKVDPHEKEIKIQANEKNKIIFYKNSTLMTPS